MTEEHRSRATHSCGTTKPTCAVKHSQAQYMLCYADIHKSTRIKSNPRCFKNLLPSGLLPSASASHRIHRHDSVIMTHAQKILCATRVTGLACIAWQPYLTVGRELHPAPKVCHVKYLNVISIIAGFARNSMSCRCENEPGIPAITIEIPKNLFGLLCARGAVPLHNALSQKWRRGSCG